MAMMGGACLMAHRRLLVCDLEASNKASVVWSPFRGWSVLSHRMALSCWCDDSLTDG